MIGNKALAKWVRRITPGNQGWAEVIGVKVYILPTKYGVLFGMLLMALLIGSVNYANNPAFLLTFLLAGLLTNTMFSTWRNLRGIKIRWLKANAVFAGQEAEFMFEVFHWDNRPHHAIHLALDPDLPTIFNIDTNKSNKVSVKLSSQKRGRLKPTRITLESRYPLGLLRAWCYLQAPEVEAIIYPIPGEHWAAPAGTNYRGSLNGDKGVGTDDFIGHRDFHRGDSPKRIDWKVFAAGKGLLVKQFGGDRKNLLWLDWNDFKSNDDEYRLRQLCQAVLLLDEQQINYGLRLPQLKISPAHGEKHRHQCLKALALFGEAT